MIEATKTSHSPGRTPRRITRNAKAAGTGWHGTLPGAVRQRNILESISKGARESLLRCCDAQRFKRGQDLYVQGGRHMASYFLVSGLVRCYHTTAKGKELTIGYWSAGDIVGGPYFFDDTKRHIWSARAAETSDVLAISGRDLKALTLSVPEIGDAVLDALCFKLLWDSALMQVLGTRSVGARLADLLVKLVALHGEPTPEGFMICRKFSQDDLASMVGATRQWVNARIVEFERRGLVAVRGHRLVVRDLPRLESLVN